MPESYRIPGRQCLVDEFVAMERRGEGSAWKAYCDCNFLQPVHQEVVKVGGVPVIRFPFESEDQFAARVKQLAAQTGKPVTIDVRQYLVRTDEWKKCVNKFCAIPTGCWNNDSNDWMPFNVHPGAALAPWTDAGAAARGIYKKDAGILYTLIQATSIDLKAYEPLTLWRNYFENPPVYYLAAAKLNLIPGIGPVLTQALTASMPQGLVFLLPLALAQAAAERKDVVRYVFKPMVTGNVKYAAFVLRAAPNVFSGNYFELAGMIAARFCQDQIDTGEIEKVGDSFSKAVIIFFAKSGEDVGRELQKIIAGGFDLSSAPGVISLLISGFNAVASIESIDQKVRDFARSVANVLRVVRVIAEGIQRKDSAFAIADAVVFEVFGFSLDQLKQAVTKGASEVQRLLNLAREKGKEGTLDGALKAFDAIAAAFDKIVSVINYINNAVQGGLENFRAQFSGFAAIINDLKGQTNTMLIQASGQGTQPLQAGVKPIKGDLLPVNLGARLAPVAVRLPPLNVTGGVGVGTGKGGVGTGKGREMPPSGTSSGVPSGKFIDKSPGRFLVTPSGGQAGTPSDTSSEDKVPPSSPPATKPLPQPSGIASALFGAGVGAAVGGPVGAAIGALVGAAMKPRMA